MKKAMRFLKINAWFLQSRIGRWILGNLKEKIRERHKKSRNVYNFYYLFMDREANLEKFVLRLRTKAMLGITIFFLVAIFMAYQSLLWLAEVLVEKWINDWMRITRKEFFFWKQNMCLKPGREGHWAVYYTSAKIL